MKKAKAAPASRTGDNPMVMGGLVAYVVHEAERQGMLPLSRKLEEIFIELLMTLSPADRQSLLVLSHEMALRKAMPEKIKLHLVGA